MIRFKENPMWCCYVGGPGTSAGEGPGGQGGGSGVGGSDGSGVGGSDGGIGAMGGPPGSANAATGFADNDAVAAAMDAVTTAMAQSDAQAAENNASGEFGAAVDSIQQSLLMAFFRGIFTGMNPLSMGFNIAKANLSLSKAKSDLAALVGQEQADAVIAATFAGFAADDSIGGPDIITPALKQLGFDENSISALRIGVQDGGIVPSSGGNNMADNQKIVKELYKDLYGREYPDQEGVDFWTKQLDDGDLTPETLKTAMEEQRPLWEQGDDGWSWTNKETGDVVRDSPIRDLYIELFDRPQPDKEGLDFWEGLWDTGEYSEDRIRDMMEGERTNWTKSPGGTQWINEETGNEQPDVDGLPVAPDASIPSNIPDSLQPGLENFVDDSWDITRQYRQTTDQLWSDYLDFEKTYFGKYEDNQQQYQDNLASMPQMNLQMPDTMGGATVPLAPKVHSAMYTDQFNAMNSGIGNQANASLAGMGSRDALSKNMFQTNLANLQNSFLPTQAGMDLYQMERAGELGIQQADAGRYEPSTLSTWAPVVGSVLQSDVGQDAMSGLWDTGSAFLGGLFS